MKVKKWKVRLNWKLLLSHFLWILPWKNSMFSFLNVKIFLKWACESVKYSVEFSLYFSSILIDFAACFVASKEKSWNSCFGTNQFCWIFHWAWTTRAAAAYRNSLQKVCPFASIGSAQTECISRLCPFADVQLFKSIFMKWIRKLKTCENGYLVFVVFLIKMQKTYCRCHVIKSWFTNEDTNSSWGCHV